MESIRTLVATLFLLMLPKFAFAYCIDSIGLSADPYINVDATGLSVSDNIQVHGKINRELSPGVPNPDYDRKVTEFFMLLKLSRVGNSSSYASQSSLCFYADGNLNITGFYVH